MDRNNMTNKSGVDIDINELVHALNSQVSTYNLELNVAKLYIAKLEGIVKELGVNVDSEQPKASTTNKNKN